MLECPACAAPVLPENHFCEECGTSLSTNPAPAPCPKCGAGSTEIDKEGFCSACGFRREERGRDHFEITLSPNVSGVSDRGLRHHRNEDFLVIDESPNKSAVIVVVCDGVSNSRDADAASQAAAEEVCRKLVDGAEMSDAICAAQEAVVALPSGPTPCEDRPATTIVAAVIQPGHATIGWLGDSRAYWIDAEGARQLTTDDSWLNEVLAAGEISEEVALKSSHAHAITRWLGFGAPLEQPPSTMRFDMPGPGALLLCTDGLWNYAPQPEQIADLVQPLDREPIEIARALIDFARSKGGHDNITAALVFPFAEPL